MRASHGWAEVSRERKREIIEAIASGSATRGPAHIELDLTDRCNVACYFCNQQDVRTKESIPLKTTVALIDELAATGLKSVRLSGGGDPLFHRDVASVLDHLMMRGVVVDNLTTNGVALTAEIARKLIDGKAREVIVSLNAIDAEDYARMMKVKPALFDTVLTNFRNLIAMRGDSMYPSVVVQFLIDKANLGRIVAMYDLGRSLGADRITLGAVGEIPNERIDPSIMVKMHDRDVAAPQIEEILRRDRDRGLLQLDFPVDGWNEMFDAVRAKLETPAHNALPTASSFKEENGGCFFAWYTAAVTGNGDIRPCCLLLNPNVKPLGNIHETATFAEHWNGPAFQKLRSEMREVLVMKHKKPFNRRDFQHLEIQCVQANMCWLKNMYFRGDEEFYAELAEALETVRAKEIRVTGSPAQRRRAITLFVQERPALRTMWNWTRERSRPARIALKSRLGIDVTDAV